MQRLEHAKQIGGVWFPESEEHFAGASYVGTRYPALDAALKYCLQRRRAVDVGAHVGLWTKWIVDDFDYVEAFEPVRAHADLFQANVTEGQWTMHPCALGEHAGSVAIKENPLDTGNAHVNGSGNIELRTLDSFAFRHVDFIKIDVEGYELPVCKGARETLLRWKPVVVIEQRGCDVDNFGFARDEALPWLESIGMKRRECVHYDWILTF